MSAAVHPRPIGRAHAFHRYVVDEIGSGRDD